MSATLQTTSAERPHSSTYLRACILWLQPRRTHHGLSILTPSLKGGRVVPRCGSRTLKLRTDASCRNRLVRQSSRRHGVAALSPRSWVDDDHLVFELPVLQVRLSVPHLSRAGTARTPARASSIESIAGTALLCRRCGRPYTPRNTSRPRAAAAASACVPRGAGRPAR